MTTPIEFDYEFEVLDLVQPTSNEIGTTIVEEAWNHQSYYGNPSMIKWTKKADGSFTFDYTWYDKWIQRWIDHGVLDPEKGIGEI